MRRCDLRPGRGDDHLYVGDSTFAAPHATGEVRSRCERDCLSVCGAVGPGSTDGPGADPATGPLDPPGPEPEAPRPPEEPPAAE